METSGKGDVTSAPPMQEDPGRGGQALGASEKRVASEVDTRRGGSLYVTVCAPPPTRPAHCVQCPSACIKEAPGVCYHLTPPAMGSSL